MFQNNSLYSYFPIAPNSVVPLNGSSVTTGNNNTTNDDNNAGGNTINDNNGSNINNINGNVNNSGKPLSTGLSGFIPTLGNLDVNSLSNLDPTQAHQDLNNANIKGAMSVDGQPRNVSPADYNHSLKSSSTSTVLTSNNNFGLASNQVSISPVSKDSAPPINGSNINLAGRNDPALDGGISIPKAEQSVPSSANPKKRTATPAESSQNSKRAKNQKTHVSSPKSGDGTTNSDAKPTKSKRKAPLTEEEKRQNFLERNRVAASKCRQRKKEMIENMKYELEDYKNENKVLREQVGTLREHALTLRTILYAHRDCALLIEQVGGIQSLNTILNATNYVAQIPQAHQNPEIINVEEVPQLLNSSGTNVQAAVAAAVAHTTNKVIERQSRLSTSQ